MPAFATIARVIGIRGFIAIGLALALAFAWWRVGVWQERAEDYAQAAANEQASHAVTRASVQTLTVKIAELNFEANARADAFERARRQAARENERLRGQAVASDARIARLRRIAPGQCEAPDDLLRELEGL